MVVVSYDVSVVTPNGRKRLRRVAKVCCDFGLRVQNSVFHCLVSYDQWVIMRSKLLKICDPKEDSLRFYFLGKNWRNRLEHHGTKEVPDLDRPLIV